MGIRFTVTVRKGRTQEELNQIPFATSLALTRVAKAFVEKEKTDLPKYFTIRRNWVAKGFRVKAADKVNLEAVITHLDDYMGRQEHGGQKLPRPGGARSVAVPKGARTVEESITTRSQWPGRLKRAFYVEKPNAVLQFQRFGPRKPKGRRGKYFVGGRDLHPSSGGARQLRKQGLVVTRKRGERDPKLRLMYILKRQVRVPPRWGFEDRARPYIGLNLEKWFEAALREAMSTAL